MASRLLLWVTTQTSDMATYKSLDWYKKHPEVLVRHHGERWTDLHIHILLLCFANKESLHEMTRMLGRTENGVLAQLVRQKQIWCDASGRIGRRYSFYFRKPIDNRSIIGYTQNPYNGKNFR